MGWWEDAVNYVEDTGKRTVNNVTDVVNAPGRWVSDARSAMNGNSDQAPRYTPEVATGDKKQRQRQMEDLVGRDFESRDELTRQLWSAGNSPDFSWWDKELANYKEGVGIYGVRRKIMEQAKMAEERPGRRQTILTQGTASGGGIESSGLLMRQGEV